MHIYFEWLLNIGMIICLINVAIVIKHHGEVTNRRMSKKNNLGKL